MTAESPNSQQVHRKWYARFQAGDFAWLLFVFVLLATAPEPNYDALILLPLIGAFQIVEPRLRIFSSGRGQIVSITLKLVLSYLLIGFSHGADSYYSSIFLIPVVSAATLFDLTGVVLVTAIACALYFSFLLPVFVDLNTAPPDLLSLMSLRAAFYAIVAFLVFEQAKAKRDEMARTQEAADRLAASNRNLQRAEASLRRSERLAALGQLTAGLAHELRNPLGTIRASAEMLTKESTRKRPEVMAEMAGYIGTEADRMNGLISNFLDFARPLQVRPVTGELRALCDDVAAHVSDLAANRQVKLIIRLDEAPLKFTFDPDLLRLAILNLAQNAIQASPSGSTVEIRASSTHDTVELSVTDHGEGIQPQHLENIFNPFFTTKPDGVGLGLAIVSKIVDEHRGRIRVASEPGSGTTFTITLPREQPI
jgi:two-component system, NtrC family, sensor histidine kinase HydH